MRDCTRQERLARTADNKEDSKKRIADVQKKMSELKHDNWRDNLKEKLDANHW